MQIVDLFNNSRTVWPTKISMLFFFQFSGSLLQVNHKFSKKKWWKKITWIILVWGTLPLNQTTNRRKNSVSTQWRNFAWGCLWARDGWVPNWLRSVCNTRGPCEVESRSPLKGPGCPGGGPGANPLVLSKQKQHFQRKLIYIRLLSLRHFCKRK